MMKICVINGVKHGSIDNEQHSIDKIYSSHTAILQIFYKRQLDILAQISSKITTILQWLQIRYQKS